MRTLCLAEHRDYVKKEDISKPAGEHFNSRGHTVANLKGIAFEKVRSKDPFVLGAREKLYI